MQNAAVRLPLRNVAALPSRALRAHPGETPAEALEAQRRENSGEATAERHEKPAQPDEATAAPHANPARIARLAQTPHVLPCPGEKRQATRHGAGLRLRHGAGRRRAALGIDLCFYQPLRSFN